MSISRIFKNKNESTIKSLPYSVDYLILLAKDNSFYFANAYSNLEQTREEYRR
jgi:hypothetical protein